MTKSDHHTKTLRILLLEDEVVQAGRVVEAIAREFDRRVKDNEFQNCQLVVFHIIAASELIDRLFDETFNFLILDLRVPKFPGEALTAEPLGLTTLERLRYEFGPLSSLGLTSGAVLTHFAKEHWDVKSKASRDGFEFWQKAAGDADPSLPVPSLDSELVARFVLDRLQDYGPAMHSACRALEECLPTPMAGLCEPVGAMCVSAAAWISAQGDTAKQRGLLNLAAGRRLADRQGLAAVCQLGELAREWLWVVAAAHLTLNAKLPRALANFAVSGNGIGDDGVHQPALKERLLDIALLAMANWAATDRGDGAWPCQRVLSHLEVELTSGETGSAIVAALRSLRQLDSRLAGQRLQDDDGSLPGVVDAARSSSREFAADCKHSASVMAAGWSEAILPLRRILDGLSLFNTHALVTRLQLIAPGYVQAHRFKAARPVEAQIGVQRIGNEDAKELGLKGDPQQLYLVWPRRNGRADLLPLWPWVARIPSRQSGELKTYFFAGRDKNGFPIGLEVGELAEETFSSGQDACRWRQTLD